MKTLLHTGTLAGPISRHSSVAHSGISSAHTSKTAALNHILLRAWRERWSDAQFGIAIKTVLPRGISGDVYNLADCILKQALVGSDANRLVLSYLRHALCSHLISHAAMLRRIATYDRFECTYSMLALLELLAALLPGTTCRTRPEEAYIANAVLSLVAWLARAYQYLLDQMRTPAAAAGVTAPLGREHAQQAELCTAVLDTVAHHQFLRACCVVGAHESPELAAALRAAYVQIKNDTANAAGAIASPAGGKQPFDELLRTVCHLGAADLPGLAPAASGSPFYESMAYCIQPLLTVKVLQHPHAETRAYVADLQMIRAMKSYSLARLYYELLRACMMSLLLSDGATESLWCAFTFIKVPQVMRELSSTAAGQRKSLADAMATATSPPQPAAGCPDALQALELLVDDTVLDSVDTKCGCNSIDYLLTEMRKQQLVTEADVKRLSERRIEHNAAALAKVDYTATSIIRYVICAETPFNGILKALFGEYTKMAEPLLGMLVQVLVGNSLELILSVASVQGKLRTFVARLIACNEQSLQQPLTDQQSAAAAAATGPGIGGSAVDKPSAVRSSLFDVSFLLLTCIVQQYGSPAVLFADGRSTPPPAGTFFERWLRDCMFERTRQKSPARMTQPRNGAADVENNIDELLLHMGMARIAAQKLTPSSASSAATTPNAADSAASAAAAAAAAAPTAAGNALASCPHVAWQDVCVAVPGMLHHILVAWENETLSLADVRFYLDAMRSRMCAFTVCAAAWLNAHMLLLRADEQQRPLQMLQMLMGAVGQPDDLTQKESYAERHKLAVQIMRKMEQDAAAAVVAVNAGSGTAGQHHQNNGQEIGVAAPTSRSGVSLNLATVRPLAHVFNDMWQLVLRQGALPLSASLQLEAMLATCGPYWLVARMLEKIFACKFAKEMLVAMDIVFALMHVDIRRCTVALLSEWLPMLLMNRMQNIELLAPHSGVLARLCVMCILATMETAAAVETGTGAGLKRRHSPATAGDGSDPNEDRPQSASPTGTGTGCAADIDLDSVGPMLKVRKIEAADAADSAANTTTGDFVFDLKPQLGGTASTTQGNRPAAAVQIVAEPLQSVLLQMFRQFDHFLCIEPLSPKIYFITQCMQLLVQVGGVRAKQLVRLAPAAMMQNLLRVMVCDEYTAGFILSMYDLDSVAGRRQSMTDLSMLRNIQLRNESIDL